MSDFSECVIVIVTVIVTQETVLRSPTTRLFVRIFDSSAVHTKTRSVPEFLSVSQLVHLALSPTLLPAHPHWSRVVCHRLAEILQLYLNRKKWLVVVESLRWYVDSFFILRLSLRQLYRFCLGRCVFFWHGSEIPILLLFIRVPGLALAALAFAAVFASLIDLRRQFSARFADTDFERVHGVPPVQVGLAKRRLHFFKGVARNRR